MSEKLNTKKIVGHNVHKANLLRLIENKKLPHALFFCGQSGIGKKLLGVELAKYIFCENKNYNELYACSDCKHCKLFESGNYPDFHFIDCKDQENFNTDTIKKILYTLNLKSYEGSKRFILFEGAEGLKEQAANALLKILEEPPKNTYFCLIGSSTKSIPTTITSRCQVWHFKNLTAQELNEVISINEFEKPENYQELLKLSNGSIETYLNFSTDEEVISKFLNLISEIRNHKQEKISELIKIITDYESLFLDFIRFYTRKELRESQNEIDLSFWSNFLSQILYIPELRKRNVRLNSLYSYVLTELLQYPDNENYSFDLYRLVT